MRRIILLFLFLFALLSGMNAWAAAVEKPTLCSFSVLEVKECLPGEYLENKDESDAVCNCVPCPEGTYSTKVNVTACTACTTTPCDPTTGEPLEPEFNDYKFTATIDLSSYDDNHEFWGVMPVTEFGFDLGASGTFYVDWGDGTTETIKKDNTDAVTYTHDYGTTSGTYTVKIGGLATDYSDDEYTPAISFGVDIGASSAYSQAITEISGSLGAIFSTLSDGSQPRFPSLFYRASFAEIPSGLFDGIHGAPVSNMFEEAFGACHNLTSIPENLFAGITGNAPYMFSYTFNYCSNLTSIPENLFSGITGAAEGMFGGTFAYCSNLTGPSARINGKYLYDLWPDNVADWGAWMYDGAAGLDDYACIPAIMGGGGEECATTPSDPTTGEPIDFNDDSRAFYMTVEPDVYGLDDYAYGFYIGARGVFQINWGDGSAELIQKTDVGLQYFNHIYRGGISRATIRIAGRATAYDEGINAFKRDSNLSFFTFDIDGCLGCVFPTLPDGSQPNFSYAFDSTSITSIPENIFNGITGNLTKGMFVGTFYGCEYLTGPSARINGKYLYDIWPNATDEVTAMYSQSSGLEDYLYIPTAWGGLGQSREQLCAIGVSQIKTSTGLAFALYAEKYTQPSMAIKYNNGICYGKLEQGNQSGTINVNYNGIIYHLVD